MRSSISINSLKQEIKEEVANSGEKWTLLEENYHFEGTSGQINLPNEFKELFLCVSMSFDAVNPNGNKETKIIHYDSLSNNPAYYSFTTANTIFYDLLSITKTKIVNNTSYHVFLSVYYR